MVAGCLQILHLFLLALLPVSNVKHYVNGRVESSNAGVESIGRENSMTVTTNLPNDISQQAQTLSSTNKRSIVVPPEPPDITQTDITYTDIQWTTTKTADSVFPVTDAPDRQDTTDVRGTSNERVTVGNTDHADVAATFVVTTEANKSEVEGKRTTVIPESVLADTKNDLRAEAITHLPVTVYNNAGHMDDADTTDTTDAKWTTVKSDDFSHVTDYPNMEGTTGVADKSYSTKIAGNIDGTDRWSKSVTTEIPTRTNAVENKRTKNAAGNERTTNIPGDALPFRNGPDTVGDKDLSDKSDKTTMADNTDDTISTDEGNNFAATETIITEGGYMKEDITKANVLKTPLGTLIAKYTTRTHSRKVATTVDSTAMFTVEQDRSDASGTVINAVLFSSNDNLSDHTTTKEPTSTVYTTVDTTDSHGTDNVTSLNGTRKDTDGAKAMDYTSRPHTTDGQTAADNDIKVSYSTGVENSEDDDVSSPPQDRMTVTEPLTTPTASVTTQEDVEYVYRNTSQERIKGVVVDTSLGIQVCHC